MAGQVQIRVKDNGYTDRLRAIKSLDGRVKAKAGVQGPKAAALHDSESGLTTAELGQIHEFGLGVPERSFVRAWFDENQRAINQELQRDAREVVAGKWTVYEAMEEFGKWAAQEISVRIEAGLPGELSDSTVRRKGHATPLVDTGKLLAAITNSVARES